MKNMTPSYIRAQIAKFEAGQEQEREYLQNVLDLCIERIIDLDQGRDDGTVTGSYKRSELAAVLVEAEMLNSQPPPAGEEVVSYTTAPGTHSLQVIDLASDELDEEDDPSMPPCPRITSRVLARLDANHDCQPLTELSKQILVREGETFSETTHRPVSLTLKDTKTGDSFTVLPRT